MRPRRLDRGESSNSTRPRTGEVSSGQRRVPRSTSVGSSKRRLTIELASERLISHSNTRPPARTTLLPAVETAGARAARCSRTRHEPLAELRPRQTGHPEGGVLSLWAELATKGALSHKSPAAAFSGVSPRRCVEWSRGRPSHVRRRNGGAKRAVFGLSRKCRATDYFQGLFDVLWLSRPPSSASALQAEGCATVH